MGCSKTQAEQLARYGLITSVVPMCDEGVGMTWGNFDRDDLASFLAAVCRGAKTCSGEDDRYADLTAVVRSLSSTLRALEWQLEGKLRRTRLLNGIPRLDNLRFHRPEVKALVKGRRGPNLHRLSTVTLILGVRLSAAKKLVAVGHGGPWLLQAPPEDCRSLQGGAYVSTTEIERFQASTKP